MARFFCSLIVCLCLGLAEQVLAAPEVHVVVVGQGHQTSDFYALPEARVQVDRPGQEVGLVLLDDGKVHWKVEATAGTIVSEIVRSGPRGKTSKITFYGIPMAGVQDPGLPVVFHPWGRDFRLVVDALADWFGTDRIHSFQGMHTVGAAALTVDRVDWTTAGLARDYLSHQVGSLTDLPPKISNWIDNGDGENEFAVEFDQDGLRLTGAAGTRQFPVSPDIPEVLLPAMGVYDAASQTIYCITYGAEGYLYSVDVRTGTWAVVTSLDGYDAAGLLFDRDNQLLVATGAFSRPGEIRVFGLDGQRAEIFVPTTAFPGLTDLFDYGNEHGPPLIPLVHSDGWVLVEAHASRTDADPETSEHRLYAVQIETGEVRLLRFHND